MTEARSEMCCSSTLRMYSNDDGSTSEIEANRLNNADAKSNDFSAKKSFHKVRGFSTETIS